MSFHGKYGVDGRPQITSPLTDSGVEGTAYSYAIMATNAPTSYDAVDLPAGLSVDTNTGIISGTPTVHGVFEIPLTATNDSGTRNPVLLTLTLIAASGTLSKTTIRNSGDTRFIGYLPPHGRVLASGDQITIDGDLHTLLAMGPGKRYSGRAALDALNADILNGDIVLIQAG